MGEWVAITLGPQQTLAPGPAGLGVAVHWLVNRLWPSKLLSKSQQKGVDEPALKATWRIWGFWLGPLLESRTTTLSGGPSGNCNVRKARGVSNHVSGRKVSPLENETFTCK